MVLKNSREVLMSLKDKLEIGLKPDAPFRKDNLPDFQQDDPACDAAASPSDTPSVERARKECTMPPVKQEQIAKEREAERAREGGGDRETAHDRPRTPAPHRTTTGR
jgi:hypothetical protein